MSFFGQYAWFEVVGKLREIVWPSNRNMQPYPVFSTSNFPLNKAATTWKLAIAGYHHHHYPRLLWQLSRVFDCSTTWAWGCNVELDCSISVPVDSTVRCNDEASVSKLISVRWADISRTHHRVFDSKIWVRFSFLNWTYIYYFIRIWVPNITSPNTTVCDIGTPVVI